MQPIIDGPRLGLVASQVLSLLTKSSSVKIQGGLERYDNTLTFVSDLSGSLQNGSSVSSDCTAQIHRSCTLVLDANAPLNYLSDFVKPYMTITDTVTGFTARFNLGVYSLVSPSPDLTLAPGQASYTGYDLLQVLNQPIGDTYEVANSQDPIAKAQTLISTIFPAATFVVTPNTKLTAQVYTWPLDNSNTFSYLGVVNDLLAIVGYSPLWVDWDGNFRMQPYVDPNKPDVGAEWAFDLSVATDSIVNESRSVFQDLFDVPNQWVFIMSNLPAAPVEGSTQFTFTDNVSPVTSVAARGRVIRRVFFVDAVDYASLVAVGVYQIETDLHPTETFAISTFPVPLFWHRDIATYNDPVLGTIGPLFLSNRRVMVKSWSLPLDVVSGDMGMTLLSTSAATTAASG